MAGSDRAKRVVGAVYSAAAGHLYEPLVVHGTFPLLAGKMPDLVREQGRRAVAVAAGGPILDLPVGTAYYTVPTAKEHDGLVVGVDIARGMVVRAAAVAAEHELDNLRTLQADVHHLPFPDDAFPAILCTNGLQVIPGLRPSLEELARVLSPGGTLFVSVITLPTTRLRPQKKDSRPTWMLAGTHIADAIADTGLEVTGRRRERFATLIEATKAKLL
jgi:ubiquinone/menaquinone biosynthesis C-methylase UbiE